MNQVLIRTKSKKRKANFFRVLVPRMVYLLTFLRPLKFYVT